MTTAKFVLFNFIFWVGVCLLLFFSGWSHVLGHLEIALTRFLYIGLVGMALSLALSAFYKGEFFSRQKSRIIWVILGCAIAALLTALIINPISYLMAGHNLKDIHEEIITTGTLYNLFFYFTWSVIYFHLVGQSPFVGEEENQDAQPFSFKVEKGGEKRVLQARDICFIRANGDYVDLITPDNEYMIKDTLSNLESELDPSSFKRVHRSAIVNKDKVEKVTAKAGGAYEITLFGNKSVSSSRSYKAVIEEILPKG